MKPLLLTILILFLPLLAFAEEAENIPWEEKYNDYPVACLLNEKMVELKDNWSFSVKEHVKLRIQKESAKDLGEIPVKYNKARQKVTDIKAYTITSDGKKHKYSKIQDLHVYKGYPMYSDARVKIISMPEVKVGSIIEYETTTITKRLPIKDSFWYFDKVDLGVPIKENKLTIDMSDVTFNFNSINPG